MRRFNSDPRLQILPQARRGVAQFVRATVSKPVWSFTPFAEFHDAPLKLDHYSLTRGGYLPLEFRACPGGDPSPCSVAAGLSREDATAVRQATLRPRDRGEACTLLQAKNEAHRQPFLNLQIARTYLTAVDPEIARRPGVPAACKASRRAGLSRSVWIGKTAK